MKNLQVLDAVETLSQLSQATDKSHPELLPQPERIKKAFSTINQYLSGLYESDQMLLKNHDYLASLKAVMVIAEEAYDKLDLVSKIFSTAKSNLGESEFTHLYDFYLKKINYKVEHVAGEMFRHAEAEKNNALSDTHGLKNLEVIRKDTDYELFYVKDEDGLNHFSKNLLRHTQLLGTFDELFLFFQGDDPFVKLKFIEDRVKQKRALEIRQDLAPRIDYFLKESFRFKKQVFIGQSCQMLISLFLASYPSLALQNDPFKACYEYFNDFMGFLSSLILKAEFFKTSSTKELISDKGVIASQRFIAGVIKSLFTTKNEIKYLAEHLYQFIPRPKIESFSPISFFDKLLEFDQSLRKFLSNFPSGPLMKALDFIKEEQKPTSFDPMRTYLPQNLLNLSHNEKTTTVILTPSPTVQSDVISCDIDPIFHVFLQQLEGQSTLMINLEDPHHIYSKARVRAVLSLEKPDLLCSVIPRLGLLYSQADIYSFINETEEFKKVIFSQFEEEEGFNYSESKLYKKDMTPIFNMVLAVFFDNKKSLELRERLVFIELMQLFMAVSLIDKYQVDNLIIMCKDGLDNSNVMGLSLYALVQLINNNQLLDKFNLDLFISELYGPAMTVRDRPVLEDSFVRMAGALSLLQAKLLKEPSNRKKILEAVPILKELKLRNS